MNYDSLLEKAKNGTIARDEIEVAATALTRKPGGADPYTLLHILGRANAREHRSLVEQYLYEYDDPMLARLALQILCSYWDDTDVFARLLLHFVSGDSKDVDNDVRTAALGISGEYLSKHDDRALLAKVLHSFENSNEDRNVREAAYRALARASGLQWSHIPPASRHFDLSSVPDPELVLGIKRRLVAAQD
jgi:hypothetical protein